MRAADAKLLDFLKGASQLVVPIYQRTYSWTEKECRQLWDDIVRVGKNESATAHFMGSVVYVAERLTTVVDRSPLLVIDGQQRLTTVSLLLEALARALDGSALLDEPLNRPLNGPLNESLNGLSAQEIRNDYLIRSTQGGQHTFKLRLTQTDEETLCALVRQKQMPQNYSVRVKANFVFFEQQIAAQPDDVAALCKGLCKLVVVDVALERGQDNPQLIFESMNSTGRALSQADLIRNFILMGLAAPSGSALSRLLAAYGVGLWSGGLCKGF